MCNMEELDVGELESQKTEEKDEEAVLVKTEINAKEEKDDKEVRREFDSDVPLAIY